MTQGHSLREISIEQVKPGMFLQDVFNSDGLLLLCANTAITDIHQIERLKALGVKTVFIDTEKGSDLGPSILPSASQPAVLTISDREREYFKELEKAKQVHQSTIITAKETLNAVRMGKSFSAKELEVAAEQIVQSILRNPDALVSLTQIKGYDEYTYVHSVNVAILMTSLARSMGYSNDQLLDTGLGGMLHDIGKMRVPETILNKPGKYTDTEFNIMKRHPEYGMEIVKGKQNISDFSRLIIIEHHERYNGKGYPLGRQGEKIHEIGLIAAVADVYDAMTTDRVYRPAWTPQRALALIFQGCDTEYSRHIVELFTKHLGIYPVGSFVRLASGEMGIVIRIEKGELLAPDVLILFSPTGERLSKPVEYHLSQKQKEINGEKYIIELSLNPAEYHIEIGNYINSKLFE